MDLVLVLVLVAALAEAAAAVLLVALAAAASGLALCRFPCRFSQTALLSPCPKDGSLLQKDAE